MSNIIHIEGYPDLTYNNTIFSCRLGVSKINVGEVARTFGNKLWPYGSVFKKPSRVKIIIGQSQASNEWYSERMRVPMKKERKRELKKHGLWRAYYAESSQEDRLNRMRDAMDEGKNTYKEIWWNEPWLPPCTIVLFESGSISITSPRTKPMALYAASLFVYYLNHWLGIPATIQNPAYRNIVCDTDLGFPLDLEKLPAILGSLVKITDNFPAAIVGEKNNNRMVSLVYATGKIVQTGGVNDEEIIDRHKRIVDVARQCRVDAPNSGSVMDRRRKKMNMHKKNTSKSNLAEVNKIMKSILEQGTANVGPGSSHTPQQISAAAANKTITLPPHMQIMNADQPLMQLTDDTATVIDEEREALDMMFEDFDDEQEEKRKMYSKMEQQEE